MVRKQTGNRKKTKAITKQFFLFYIILCVFLFKVNVGNSAVKNLNPNAQLFSSSDFNNGTVLAGSTVPSGMKFLSRIYLYHSSFFLYR
jgi:hypothetical protein